MTNRDIKVKDTKGKQTKEKPICKQSIDKMDNVKTTDRETH